MNVNWDSVIAFLAGLGAAIAVLFRIFQQVMGHIYDLKREAKKLRGDQESMQIDAKVIQEGLIKRGYVEASKTSHIVGSETEGWKIASDTARKIYEPIATQLKIIYSAVRTELERDPTVTELGMALEKGVLWVDGKEQKLQDWMITNACPVLHNNSFGCVAIASVIAREDSSDESK